MFDMNLLPTEEQKKEKEKKFFFFFSFFFLCLTFCFILLYWNNLEKKVLLQKEKISQMEVTLSHEKNS